MMFVCAQKVSFLLFQNQILVFRFLSYFEMFTFLLYAPPTLRSISRTWKTPKTVLIALSNLTIIGNNKQVIVCILNKTNNACKGDYVGNTCHCRCTDVITCIHDAFDVISKRLSRAMFECISTTR